MQTVRHVSVFTILRVEAIIVNQGSHLPAIEQGELPPFAVLFQNDDGTPYTATNLSAETGAILGNTNLPPGAITPNTTSLGLHGSGQAHLNLVMTFPSVAGIYNIQSISFASRGSGNGFQQVTLQMSTGNGGSGPISASSRISPARYQLSFLTIHYILVKLSASLTSSCGCISPTDSPMAKISRI